MKGNPFEKLDAEAREGLKNYKGMSDDEFKEFVKSSKKDTLQENFDAITRQKDAERKEAEEMKAAYGNKKHKKKSKPSLLEALTEAHKDNFISKSMFEKYKKDIDEGDTKALKSRLKSYDYPFEEEDDEPIEKYVSVENYEGVKKTRGRPKKEKVAKEKLKPVTLVEIGHELNTRTRKEKLSPEKKREIYDFVMKF